MKAGKPDAASKIELEGKVLQKQFAKGSKSEHDALYLETEQGSFVLRRVGGNPFSDPVLKKLIGKKVMATGTINGHLFLATEIKELKKDK